MRGSASHTIETDDGWRLLLRRLGPAGRSTSPPLLMLHGFGANGFCLANRAGPSLGHYLAARGIDVWLLDFRGTSSSQHGDRPRAFRRIAPEDKILHDLPVAMRRVSETTGATALDLLGFSLGGTITYGYLSHFRSAEVRRVVTLAAPLRFHLPRLLRLLRGLARAPGGARVVPRRLPLRPFTRLGARTRIVFPARDHFNLANVDRAVLLEMMRHGSEDASSAELLQLLDWSDRRRLASLDGRIDFAAHLDDVQLPVLLIGGAADAHVRPESLVEVLATLGSPCKRLVVVGRSSGARVDYGHTDLLLGPQASKDVYPHVYDWLTTAAPTAAPHATPRASQEPPHSAP